MQCYDKFVNLRTVLTYKIKFQQMINIKIENNNVLPAYSKNS